jgi:hypothetical protein
MLVWIAQLIEWCRKPTPSLFQSPARGKARMSAPKRLSPQPFRSRPRPSPLASKPGKGVIAGNSSQADNSVNTRRIVHMAKNSDRRIAGPRPRRETSQAKVPSHRPSATTPMKLLMNRKQRQTPARLSHRSAPVGPSSSTSLPSNESGLRSASIRSAASLPNGGMVIARGSERPPARAISRWSTKGAVSRPRRRVNIGR